MDHKQTANIALRVTSRKSLLSSEAMPGGVESQRCTGMMRAGTNNAGITDAGLEPQFRTWGSGQGLNIVPPVSRCGRKLVLGGVGKFSSLGEQWTCSRQVRRQGITLRVDGVIQG